MSDTQSSAPIFVVGVPRSGTTLLSAMLGAHPRLVCGPEAHFFDHLPEDADDLCRRDDWPAAAIDYLYSIRHVGESIPGNYELTREDLAEALSRRDPSIPSILSGMIDLYAARKGRPRWVEKTPDQLPYVDRMRRYYPDSPIIRIVRDPRAVAASVMALPWGLETIFDAINRWKYLDDMTARFFETDPRCHTLRYEDLVRDPEPVLRELCRAIGEPFDPAMLDTRESARRVNAANEPYKAKVAEKVDASRAAAWRERFSDDELRLAEAFLGDRIRAYGYPAAGPACPYPVEVHCRALLFRYGDLVAELSARGARFWSLPGERPRLSLFLGDPNLWLGRTRLARFADTARVGWTIVHRRLGGIPVAWLDAPALADVKGFCAGALSRLLLRPMASHHLPEFAHPGDPAEDGSSSSIPGDADARRGIGIGGPP